MKTIVPVSLGNNGAGIIWEQSCQSHLRIIMAVSLGNSFAIVTWEQLRQFHLGTFVPVLLRNNLARSIWEQLEFNLSYFRLAKEMDEGYKIYNELFSTKFKCIYILNRKQGKHD